MINEITKILEKNKEDIIKMRLDGVKAKEIAAKYKLKAGTVLAYLNRHEIKIRGDKNNPETIKKICDMYNNNIGMNKIADVVHLYEGTIKQILVDNNIHIKTISEASQLYSVDAHYFDNMNTSNQAYILGLLYADGSISKSSNAININLQARDRDILDKINKEIGSNKPLRFIDYSNDPCRQNQYLLNIQNKHISNALYKYGLVPNKEFKVKYPSFLDDELIPHFIRGYMDGDGYISHNPKEKRMSLTGTEMLLNGIKEYIERTLNVHCTIYNPHGKPTVTRTLGVAGGNQVKKVLDYIYKDADLYLNRKYNIYVDMYCSNN